MNYFLFLVGKKLYNVCDSGSYEINIYGGAKLNKKNIALGWEIESYKFQKFKSTTSKIPTKRLHQVNKEIKYLKEIFFFVRDLINLPANIPGPFQLF